MSFSVQLHTRSRHLQHTYMFHLFRFTKKKRSKIFQVVIQSDIALETYIFVN